MWKIFAMPGDRLIYIFLGTLGAALAMLGPGAFPLMLAYLAGSASSFRLRRVSRPHTFEYSPEPKEAFFPARTGAGFVSMWPLCDSMWGFAEVKVIP